MAMCERSRCSTLQGAAMENDASLYQSISMLTIFEVLQTEIRVT